jgi:hypothetical protein
MTPELIQRYQPGGDIYAQLDAKYGRGGALIVAQAARTGDRFAVNNAIERVRYGERMSESTARIFWGQITTDPFDAPLASLDKTLQASAGSLIKNIFKNPWVLLLVAALVFHAFGGFNWLGNKLKLA